MVSTSPLLRSSTTRMPLAPCSTSRSMRCEPMKDAPPVTRMRLVDHSTTLSSPLSVVTCPFRNPGLTTSFAVAMISPLRPDTTDDGDGRSRLLQPAGSASMRASGALGLCDLSNPQVFETAEHALQDPGESLPSVPF